MIATSLKIAFRKLVKNKFQSLVLIGGLTIGLTACLLLLRYVNFELSFDTFHSKSDRIFRIVNERFQNGESTQKGTITYPTIGPTMLEEFPEIKNATRIAYSSQTMVTQNNQVEPVAPSLWVDEHFLEIFDFELLAKAGLNLLDEPNQLIVTRSLAEHYFPAAKGDYQAVIGQELQIEQHPDPYKIVGVLEDVPANSLLQFEMLLSYSSFVRYMGEGADNSWQWSDFYHYLELEPNTDVAALEAKFTNFSERHFRGTEVSGSKEVFTLQPLRKAHLYSADLEYEIGKTANGKAIWALLIIAFFILVIAWINYVNLSSVRAMERAQEVGVRKAIGATKGQLLRQFLTEATLTNGISIVLALALVQILSPWITSYLSIDAASFGYSQINIPLVLSLTGVIVLGIGLSGFYPAWLLSSPQIANVLRGVYAKNISSIQLRKVLVVVQFTLSIALITGTWLVSRQIDYMSNQDLGLEVNQIITLNAPMMSNWDSTFIDRMNTFKTELSKLPEVNHAATSSRMPGERMGRIFQIQKANSEESERTFTSNFINVDFEYAETYGLKPLAGRFFRKEDHHANWEFLDKIVLNEAAVKTFGYANTAAAIGEQLRFGDRNWQIVGVLPDFHQRSLHHPIEPIIFLPTYANYHLLSLNISTTDIDQTIAQVKAKYAQFFPGNTFEYTFLDEHFQRLYESDQRFGQILSFFTLLTIIIACLGLLGLASYNTYLRTKEIGVRKVLGASTLQIIALLSKDFLKLVALAALVATPLTYFFIHRWLSNFAYRIEMPWWVFAVAGVLAIAIAFLTMSVQSVKAALANPVNSLKNE